MKRRNLEDTDMIKTTMYQLNPVRLIEEIKKRPGLYRTEQPADREEKLQLWKEVGAEIYEDWDSFNKAMAYDRGVYPRAL